VTRPHAGTQQPIGHGTACGSSLLLRGRIAALHGGRSWRHAASMLLACGRVRQHASRVLVPCWAVLPGHHPQQAYSSGSGTCWHPLVPAGDCHGRPLPPHQRQPQSQRQRQHPQQRRRLWTEALDAEKARKLKNFYDPTVEKVPPQHPDSMPPHTTPDGLPNVTCTMPRVCPKLAGRRRP